MDLGADIFIGTMTPPDTLRTAFARAFDLSSDRVAVRRAETPWPLLAELVLEYVGDGAPIPGDYPLQLLPWVPDGRGDDPATLTTLAIALGTSVLTSADDDNDLLMNLYLPDGTIHGVLVDQDDDGGIRNTSEMRQLISSHVPAVAVAS
jgi:hypothetical protein